MAQEETSTLSRGRAAGGLLQTLLYQTPLLPREMARPEFGAEFVSLSIPPMREAPHQEVTYSQASPPMTAHRAVMASQLVFW